MSVSVVIETTGVSITFIVNCCVVGSSQGVIPSTLICITTVSLSAPGLYVGLAVFPPVKVPVPLIIVQLIVVGSWLVKVAVNGLSIPSQKKPSSVKLIVAKGSIFNLNVSVI